MKVRPLPREQIKKIMEEEKKNIQKFYFNDKGDLIVESNKGIIANGEHFVKMYGNFSCNARTMGIIIERLVGVPVEIGVEEFVKYTNQEIVDEILGIENHTIQDYCVLGCSKERIEEYEHSLAIQNYTNKKIEKHEQDVKRLVEEINKFNELPWFKRIFKKISI